MNAFEKIIDEIDSELYGLAIKAHRLYQQNNNRKGVLELAQRIDAARSASFSMLPEGRKKEVAG